jgi:hypothetical protein
MHCKHQGSRHHVLAQCVREPQMPGLLSVITLEGQTMIGLVTTGEFPTTKVPEAGLMDNADFSRKNFTLIFAEILY